jgi:hypothetical protein
MPVVIPSLPRGRRSKLRSRVSCWHGRGLRGPTKRSRDSQLSGKPCTEGFIKTIWALPAPRSLARAVRYVFSVSYAAKILSYLGHILSRVCGGEEGTDGSAVGRD